MANTVTFSSTETDICIDGLWQYDIGQTLDIMGLVPTGTPEMHWAYSALADLTPPQTIDIRTMTEVTTGEGEAAETYYTVDIPDLALSTADEVVGYIYDEGTGTGETIAVVRFYVEEREEPTDYAGVNDVVTLQGLINATPHNNLASKQGGTTNQYYHLTSAEVGKVGKIKTSAAGIGVGTDALKDAIAGGGVVSGNFAYGDNSLEKLTNGANNIGVGNNAGKESFEDGDLTNASCSIFLGNHTKAKANGSINEIVIGAQAVGAGNNTATFGNEDIEDTILRGDVHVEKLVATDGVSPAEGVTPAENDDSEQLATTAFVKNALDGVTGNEGAAIVQMTPNEYAALENKGVTTFYLVDGIDDIGVTGVALNKESTSIYVGSTEQLTAVVSPENATDKTVVWSSSNEAVATVDQTGLVTAVSAGSATITVTTNSNNFTDTCAVTSQAVPAYPALWQGQKTKNGITFTISGNEVTLNGTKNNNDYTAGSAYYTENVINIFNAQDYDAWFSLAYGESISLKITKISGTHTGLGDSNAAIAIRDPSNNVLATLTWKNLSTSPQTISYTAPPGGKNIRGIFSYIDTNAVLSSLKIKIECTVNGTRWF
jgi:uncharacterized protein YjdB